MKRENGGSVAAVMVPFSTCASEMFNSSAPHPSQNEGRGCWACRLLERRTRLKKERYCMKGLEELKSVTYCNVTLYYCHLSDVFINIRAKPWRSSKRGAAPPERVAFGLPRSGRPGHISFLSVQSVGSVGGISFLVNLPFSGKIKKYNLFLAAVKDSMFT